MRGIGGESLRGAQEQGTLGFRSDVCHVSGQTHCLTTARHRCLHHCSTLIKYATVIFELESWYFFLARLCTSGNVRRTCSLSYKQCPASRKNFDPTLISKTDWMNEMSCGLPGNHFCRVKKAAVEVNYNRLPADQASRLVAALVRHCHGVIANASPVRSAHLTFVRAIANTFGAPLRSHFLSLSLSLPWVQMAEVSSCRSLGWRCWPGLQSSRTLVFPPFLLCLDNYLLRVAVESNGVARLPF